MIDFDPDPVCTLLEYLRTKLGLSGTKLGCGEGKTTAKNFSFSLFREINANE